jgi:tripartite-type tricarboxylate transporter receptor subunit TctC
VTIARDVLSAIALAGACLLAVAPAAAQGYPNRPVKIIVPFAPGGVDTTARLVADRLAATLGQPFVIENRPGGAGGSVGAKAVVAAEPDGYTLLFSSPGPVTISPAINRSAGYGVANFTPVAMVSSSPLMLVANPALPATTVAELVAYARANPGQVRFPSPGYGTQPHLLGEMFKSATGLDLQHVPYRGSAPSITDLIAGQVHFYFDNFANLTTFVQAGKLRALAITGERRSAHFPDLPTMVENGYDGFVGLYWNGLLAPAGTSAAVVATLNRGVNAAMRSAEFQDALIKLGADPTSTSPEEFAHFIAAESKKWAEVAKAANIKID